MKTPIPSLPRAAGEAAHTFPLPLFHHKTDGGAEYLSDKFILCPNGDKEGIFEGAQFVVRIDGDITKDAELIGCPALDAATAKIAALVGALENLLACIPRDSDPLPESAFDAGELLLEIQSHGEAARQALAAAKGEA